MYRISVSAQITCPACYHSATIELQTLFDSEYDGLDNYPIAICPMCKRRYPCALGMPYVYWRRRPTNTIFFVIPSEIINDFQSTVHSQRLMLDDYRKHLSLTDQRLLKEASLQYCENRLFRDILADAKNESFNIGIRTLRFTPALDIHPSDEFLYQLPESSVSLKKNQMAYCKSDNSEFSKELFNEASKHISDKKTGVQIIQYQAEQHPTVTMGFNEIIIYIGSTIIIPIVVKVISDVLSNYIKDKKEPQKPEKHTLIIQVNNSSNAYCFEGTIDNLISQLEKFKRDSINTVTIPHNCHVVTIADDLVADPFFDSMKTISSAVPEYEQHFSKTTAVEFCSGSNDDEMISAKGKYLIDHKEYLRAAKLMAAHVKKTSSIELLCNYALALKHLEKYEEAEKIYFNAISTYLELPDLEDLERYAGSHSQEQIDETRKKLSPLVDASSSGMSKEELRSASSPIKTMVTDIYNFDLNELRKEADRAASISQVLINPD